MDVAKLLLRQLKVADGFAENDADHQRVAWYREQVEALKKREPQDIEEPQLGLLAAEPSSQYSGTGGPR